ncbi:MAG: rhodanese-like domain-containing protein [Acidimicrobiales bacterium]|nr:rhodanese-like domain-containing protein [Acidimicrobiales bacterium]
MTNVPADAAASEVTIDQLADALEGNAFLLDVRNPDEYVEKRVAGGVLIPLGELGARVDELPKDRKIWVICAAGARSLKAANALVGAGFDAVSVAGGTNLWVEQGRPFDSGE